MSRLESIAGGGVVPTSMYQEDHSKQFYNERFAVYHSKSKRHNYHISYLYCYNLRAGQKSFE